MLTIKSAKSPAWLNSEQTQLSIDVQFVEIGDDYLPHVTGVNSSELHSAELFQRAVADEFGQIAEFVPNVQTLEAAVTAKCQEINRWRETQENDVSARVEVDGIIYDADPNSQARIESYLVSGTAPDYWMDSDNVNQSPFTLEMLSAIHSAMLKHEFKIHDRQRIMKAEVSVLTTVDDVQSYIVGWD